MGRMLARLGERISAAFRVTAPDPFVLAILLTALTFVLVVFASGEQTVMRAGEPVVITGLFNRAALAIDYWQGGFWGLLTFGMQMCLILVTGHALASSPPVARALRSVAAAPRTGPQAVALVSACAIIAGLINWGLGLIVGAILARDVGSAMRVRGGAQAPYPLLCAAGYTSMLTWHGGLSGSAPLAAAQPDQLRALLGPELAASVGDLPVSMTIFSGMNAVATLGLLFIVPLVFMLMCPKGASADDAHRVCAPPDPAPLPEPIARSRTLPEFLERSRIVTLLVALPALFWLAVRFREEGLDALNLNTANLLFLSVGLVLHGSAVRYAGAIEDGARGCAGIILQFPLYAGIMGMMRDSGLAASLSSWFVQAAGGNEGALALMTFSSAGLVNLFVPSGGGQWAVQAPVAMQAAIDAGASPARIVMAVSYGDELTNMLQPFWALPLLGITGAKARDIVGYTSIIMVIALVWLGACLLLF